ncbi:MAG: sulfurtransferase [Acidimicrobiales bacterium]
MTSTNPLVSVDWLAAHQSDPDLVIVDSRWYLDGTDARGVYEAGHIAGAVFADLDVDISAPASKAGRHPLPTASSFAAAMSNLGIGDNSHVVVYDDCGGVVAGRLWWMLDALGRGASVLAGGIDAWTEPLQVGPTRRIEPAVFTEQSFPSTRFVTADQVAGRSKEVVVVDARSASRYSGEPFRVDARFGHVPGAVNVPNTENFVDGTTDFKTTSQLASAYAKVGIDDPDQPVVVYCGSGVSASADLLALRLLGHTNVQLYTGSWSEWGADPDRPIG